MYTIIIIVFHGSKGAVAMVGASVLDGTRSVEISVWSHMTSSQKSQL